jgi:membrane protease YdiL (CAAX protease family)
MLLICQAAFFSLIHCNALAAPGLFVAGVCFALAYARTGSVLTPVAMHAVLNFNAVLAVFFQTSMK